MAVDQPTLRRRELGRVLRQLREHAGLTAEAAGSRVDLSGPTMSRIERGATRVRPLVVNALLVLYNAPEDVRALVSGLASQAQQRGWWQQLGALPPGLGGYLALEADATILRSYDTHLIHGLLQTPDYARAQAMVARPDATDAEIERVVQVRTTRQARLTDPDRPLRLTVLVEQTALERPIGGVAVMRAQLTALLAAMELPTVTLAALPTAIGEHEGLDGPFSILTFTSPHDREGPDDRRGPNDRQGPDGTAIDGEQHPDIGHVDTRVGPLFVENADQVAGLNQAYEHLHRRALDPEATHGLLTATLDALRTGAAAPVR